MEEEAWLRNLAPWQAQMKVLRQGRDMCRVGSWGDACDGDGRAGPGAGLWGRGAGRGVVIGTLANEGLHCEMGI